MEKCVRVLHREQNRTEVRSTAWGFWSQSSSANTELKIDTNLVHFVEILNDKSALTQLFHIPSYVFQQLISHGFAAIQRKVVSHTRFEQSCKKKLL